LTDRSRRPYRQANRLPLQLEKLIAQLKREHPTWGAPKIREKIRRLHEDLPLPISTVHAILDRHELVDHSRRRRYKATSRKARTRRCRSGHTIYGAWFTKASLCSPISATATR
jgi:hypothetical protein